MLRREALNFGMEFEERDGELIVVNEGTAPMAVATSEVIDLGVGAEPVEE